MTGTPTSLSRRLKKGMRYQGSGMSFFTMSTGIADTYRSAVMDSPLSRLYCLQAEQRSGEGGRRAAE